MLKHHKTTKPSKVADPDTDVYLYSKNPEMVTTSGYRMHPKLIHEGFM